MELLGLYNRSSYTSIDLVLYDPLEVTIARLLRKRKQSRIHESFNDTFHVLLLIREASHTYYSRVPGQARDKCKQTREREGVTDIRWASVRKRDRNRSPLIRENEILMIYSTLVHDRDSEIGEGAR